MTYYLGKYFRDKLYSKENAKDGFSLQISAFGPLLYVARVELVDGTPIVLQRYLDFDVPADSKESPLV